ncbi:hypothetical protein CK203_051254 [Vitis vinifera]|uniref:Retrovirus-related Pol polyprotein from transposon RE1 n=1 Tax=Vitis vinifera TaxID=29760 RepID=A0A438H837_VITVI|nr:hypothetical protein CK203_051254 [Vitis vinifera]
MWSSTLTTSSTISLPLRLRSTFQQLLNMVARATWHLKDAIFRRFSGAVKVPFSSASAVLLRLHFQAHQSVIPKAPFLRTLEAPFEASFRRHTSAISGVIPAPFQAPYKRHFKLHTSTISGTKPHPSGAIEGALGSAVSGVFSRLWRRHLQCRSGTIGSAIFWGYKSLFARRVEALQAASWLGLHQARVQSTWVAARTSLSVLKQSTGWQKNRILVLPSISDIRCEVPELRRDNFKIWNERILLQLGCMDIDYAIRKDEPHKITDTSTPDEILLYERWEKSNRLSLMYIKTKISTGICGSIEQHENVCKLLKAIDEQFVTSDKALASTLIMKFTSLKLTGIRVVREHIMEMRDIVAQLKKLEVEMSESFLVHFILNTLLPQYGPFKISYNTHKDKRSINELMTMCVQEEGRLLME